MARVGITVRGNSRTLWADAKRDGRLVEAPRPGDLAFFDHTYDANGNGRVDDELTHVAVVVGVEDDGTVEMIHFGSRRIRPLYLNLREPDVRRRGDKELNSWLRAPGYGPPTGQRLAGQLLRGFARPPRALGR